MNKPTLHLFWIAEYQDGTALSQFDPDTGDEHLFSEVDQAKLKRFGWYAFPYDMLSKIPQAVFSLILDRYTVDIPVGSQQSAVGGGRGLSTNDYRPPTLIAYRTTTLKVTLDGTPKKHEADEYVLGLDYGLKAESSGKYRRNQKHRRNQLKMHIFTDGRVELKCQH